MGNLGSIDWAAVKEDDTDGEYAVVPAGVYTVEITAAEVKDTKKKMSGESKLGMYVKVEFTIISDTQNSRKIWHNFNIENENEVATTIGLSELKKLAKACGLKALDDTNNLIGGICEVKTAVETSVQWGDSAVIKSFIGDKSKKKEVKKEDDFDKDSLPF